MGFEVSTSQVPLDGLKFYRRPMSFWWWLESRAYFNFILRELTCVFVGAFAVLTLMQIRSLGRGPEAYAAFIDQLSTPAFLIFSVVTFLSVCYHTVTFLQAVPSIVVVRLREGRVSDRAVAGVHYALWLVASLAVVFVFLR